jgi:hypothetical protein
MTFSPPTLLELRAFLAPHTGLSAGNLGIVGDTAHAKRGVSYHLGRNQLTGNAYSRKTKRDKDGLSDAASAMDIGNHKDLRRLSLALVAACQANAPGTSDIREVIYTPDGKHVFRWDRERGHASAPVKSVLRNGQWTQGDLSHLFHTHVSWYRDSEARSKLLAFKPLYGDAAMEDDVPLIEFTLAKEEMAGIIRVKDGGATVVTIDGGERPKLPPGLVRPVLGPATLKIRGELPHYVLFVGTKEIGFVSENEVEFTPINAG